MMSRIGCNTFCGSGRPIIHCSKRLLGGVICIAACTFERVTSSHSQYYYGPIPLWFSLQTYSLHSLAETENSTPTSLTSRINARVVSSNHPPRRVQIWGRPTIGDRRGQPITSEQFSQLVSLSKKSTDYGAEAEAEAMVDPNMEWKDMTGRCCEVFNEGEQEDMGLKLEIGRTMAMAMAMAMAMRRGYT
ncbi:uncharacterized protein EV420DRAFT_329976 [Desarmillaria tabescens]|uniref:Uncharacterized protein n=1 Tax=Armillaria tabescens TaxID=1929756 RepID=A0AA39KH49_ARMTA|nr:uncharacterized protein EV420DRAFT_329976 [Desarmillaria tabescens]KAK0458743.1 hypothetical protein EV420DRAFT_329976 [Desarmillaria tabescens]